MARVVALALEVTSVREIHVTPRPVVRTLPKKTVQMLRNPEAPPRTDGWTTIHYAAGCSASESLVELLSCENCPHTVDMVDKLGRTALIVCCTHGLDASAAVLLQHGANRYVTDDEGNTPMTAAVRGLHWGCVRLLLANGDYCGQIEFEWTEWQTLLILLTCVMPDLVAVYMERLHYQLLAPDSKGRLPLHYAARGGSVEVVQLLVKADVRGSSLSYGDSEGMLPLHHAARSGSVELLQQLWGAYTASSPDQALDSLLDQRKATLLHHAAAALLDSPSDAHRSVIRWLVLDMGSSLAAADAAGIRCDTILQDAGEAALLTSLDPVEYYQSYEF